VPVKAAAQQGNRRIPEKIFRVREVFNTSVDKLVEIPRSVAANLSLFNVVALFALFLCNAVHSSRCERHALTAAKQESCQFETKH
jgi:hypothetical protein